MQKKHLADNAAHFALKKEQEDRDPDAEPHEEGARQCKSERPRHDVFGRFDVLVLQDIAFRRSYWGGAASSGQAAVLSWSQDSPD